MAWCSCEGGGRVFRAKAFMVNTSAWVVGYLVGSLGPLASIVASWGSVDGLFGVCVWFGWLLQRW
jgi:hypothetical protein